MNQRINVHRFDTILKHKYKPKKNFSKKDKITLFLKLKTKCKNISSKKMIDIFINDLDNNNNYDPVNDINSSDLLADICNKDYTEILTFIEEQLCDIINSGLCPQGRSVRLFQIWEAM